MIFKLIHQKAKIKKGQRRISYEEDYLFWVSRLIIVIAVVIMVSTMNKEGTSNDEGKEAYTVLMSDEKMEQGRNYTVKSIEVDDKESKVVSVLFDLDGKDAVIKVKYDEYSISEFYSRKMKTP